jgi:hypothetical protein
LSGDQEYVMSELPDDTQQTTVDDVRRVRQQLSDEAGGDIARLAKRANQTAEALREKLGLKVVGRPVRPPNDGIAG